MLRPALAPGSHDEVFLSRYQRLIRWALRLTEGKHSAAEDLVHDAFIQFTLKQPNLAAIENLDDYLFVMLRNLHISQARRASQTPTITLAISDYDTARMGLRLVDPQRQLQARDDLRRVCEYVNQRKQTSKAASVLILRFFHSYFPAEIAGILRTSRQAVEIWLVNARRESRLYLEDPNALKVIARRDEPEGVVRLTTRASASAGGDIFSELSQLIFASREGDCFAAEQLRELYTGEETVPCKQLAHIVSCPMCLESVNQILGISNVHERQAEPGDRGDPPSASGGSGGTGELALRLRQRRRETIEHRPKELRIVVNGFFVSRQKVGMPVNELALKLNVEEKISFVEVFSEQGVLLSHFKVIPPTDGEIEQREAIEFSEGRSLETAVSFDTLWPTLKVVYRDPLVADLPDTLIDEGTVSALAVEHETEEISVRPQRFETRLTQWMRELFTVQFWLRPGVITAVFALLMLGAAWFVIRRPGPAVALTAVELLEKSINAEDLAAANTSTSIHRVFQIEQRRGGLDGEVMARQRVDVWQSAVKGVTVRRLYDDRGRLLAGEWIRADGVSTLYHQGSQPQIQIRNPEAVIRNPNDLWRLSPSAKDFNALFGASKNARLEAQANHYVVTFDGEPQKRIRSSLVLNRDDLHAIEQTWLIQQGNQTVAYRMVETSFERRPNDAVAPAVFEPEPELTSDTGIRGHGDTERIPASASLPLSASSVLATPALEVEVLHLLNQTNAFMGEQISVTRTSQGRLLVSGLVETEQRKNDLLHSLASVRGNPALHIQIETVAEAAQRARPKSSGNVSVERFETTEGTSPAYVDLKKKFSEDEARRFTDRVINRSRQARRHALALKQLAERFSLTDLRALPEADRLRWLSLLKQHARNFETEVHGLRRELQTVFSALTESGGAANGLSSDSEIQEAVRRLYELSVMVDEDVRQSFALSSQNPAGAEVKTQQFWQSLKSAEVLAARIAQAR